MAETPTPQGEPSGVIRDVLIESAKLAVRNRMRSDPRVWHEALEAALDEVLPDFWDATLHVAGAVEREGDNCG